MGGIYLHIPFCKQACYYCNFHFSTSLKKKPELILALAKELVMRREEFNNKVVETIYFGGGTPSLLTIDELGFLLNTIYNNYNVSDFPEITIEANPDDLSKEKIIELYKSPVNRLSIGIQSFFEEDLKFMNRAHTSEEAKKSLSIATRYFDNITIDLIYGIPDVSNTQWRKNLQTAFNFGIHHISAYALTIEPRTALATFIKKGKYANPSENLAHQHFDILVSETKKQGFIQYEISNFGKPNYFSKHNTSYWKGKNYIGIGPSAHSFNGKERSWNVPNNTKYCKAIAQGELPQEREILTLIDRYNEYVMIGLRTIWGVSIDKIEREFGVLYKNHILKSSKKYVIQGFLEVINTKNSTRLIITEKGKFLTDGIVSHLFLLNPSK